MDTAAMGVAQKEDEEQGVDQQDIFDRMVIFLAAITLLLFSRVLGADDTPFLPVMGTRGDPGVTAGRAIPGVGSSSTTGANSCSAAASATPQRCAGLVK